LFVFAHCCHIRMGRALESLSTATIYTVTQ
jgi:hypothetical protein